MDHITEVFVINMNESKDRLLKFDLNMKKNNIKYKRWNASNGKLLSNADLIKYSGNLCRNIMCTDGMIGCFLSHKLLWNHIQDTYKEGWFLIFEDDAHITSDFLINLKAIFEDDMVNWDEKYRRPEMINMASDIIGYKITPHLYSVPIMNTTRCYLVNMKGVNKLIKQMNKIHHHIDMSLTFYQLIKNNISFYVTKNYVKSDDNYTSTISANSYPKLFPLILNQLLNIFGLPSSYYIFYNSVIIGYFNVTVVISILLIAFLLTKKQYILCSIYALIEIMLFLISSN